MGRNTTGTAERVDTEVEQTQLFKSGQNEPMFTALDCIRNHTGKPSGAHEISMMSVRSVQAGR